MNLTSFVAAAMLLLAQAAAASPAQQALMQAIHQGDPAGINRALTAGAVLNQPLADGSLPLAWAVESQNPALVKLLLDKGARPDLGDSHLQSFSPLVVACQRGEPAIVAALLEAGAQANNTTVTGVSPLALCAGNSTAATVKKLLDQGANLEAADNTGQTPLMWAAAKGQVFNLQLLLSQGAEVNRKTAKGLTPLFFALRSGNPEAAELLLDAGADADYIAPDGTSAVQMAMYWKQFAIAERLVQRGVDLTAYDRNGNQLLHAAIIHNQPQLVAALLAKGANPNSLTGTSTVVWRYEVNFTSAPYVSYARSPLLLAAAHGSAAMMRTLIAAGADIKFRAGDGTNVVLAAAQNNPDALAFALSLAPDANVTNKYGQTPLHLLMGYSNTLSNEQTGELFRLLASRGARIDIANKWGQTPLDLATEEQFRARAEFAEIFKPSQKVKL